MAKFAIECPSCGAYAQGQTGVFSSKKILCGCGYKINLRTDSLTARTCAHCGNVVAYDQKQGANAKCPVCRHTVAGEKDRGRLAPLHCPQCHAAVYGDQGAATYRCPLCDALIDVQAQRAKQRMAKEGQVSLIQYEGGNNTFVWKHPIEDFNTGSQLIVHETQEALFFRDGQALDLFGPGRYTLDTQNLPLLEKVYQLPTGGASPFHAEIYFINQTVQMGIKWGTDSKVRLFDPISGLHIEIGASGEFNLRVCDSRRLVLKLVGTTGSLSRSDLLTAGRGDGNVSGMQGYFRALIMTQVKACLAQTIKEQHINILEIDARLTALSEALKTRINAGLEEYGLTMPAFFVVRVVTPDEDPNFKRMKQQYADAYLKVREEQIRRSEAEAALGRKSLEAQTEAQIKIIGAQGEAEALRLKAQAEAQEMQLKGYTYQQETARMVGLEAMQNGLTGEGGSGGAVGDIAGLGIALGAVGGVMGMTKDALSPVLGGTEGRTGGMGATAGANASAAQGGLQAEEWACTRCGASGNRANFCGECGAQRPQAAGWACLQCGQAGITGRFCPQCGGGRPAAPWDCPSCGAKERTGKFCSECGTKRPEEVRQENV